MIMSPEFPTYTERRVARGSHTLYARDYAGAEPAFMLMHGFPDNLRIYDALAPLLATGGRRVIAFDFLGYGGSDRPADYAYTAAGLVGDLDAVVDALGIEQVVPVGHDASGPTAIDWSLDHQDRVAALALLDTFYDAAPTLRFPELISLFADTQYAALAAAFMNDPRQFAWLLEFQGGQFRRHAPLALRERAQLALAPVIADQFGSTPSAWPAFVGLTRGLHASVTANTRRVPALAAFERPVGLVWGGGDPYLNVGVAKHLLGHFPVAELTVLPFGHWLQIDGPEEVAETLLALGVARVDGARR
jgi:pimeloyl-ACP methyl ester carboxylesterase